MNLHFSSYFGADRCQACHHLSFWEEWLLVFVLFQSYEGYLVEPYFLFQSAFKFSLLFSSSVVSNSLWPHGLQLARLLCPSLSPRVCSNSSPLSRWCHPTILSSVVPFSSCLQSAPTSGSFLMSCLFTSGGQSIGATASASVLPVNIQRLISFRICWFDLLAVQGTLESLLQHQSSKVSFLQCSAFFMVQFPHPYMTTGKTIALTRWTSVGKVSSLHFNMLSRLVMAFCPRSKCLLISWLQSPSAVILECKKVKSVTNSIVSPSIFHEVMGLNAMSLVFWMLSFKPEFSLSLLPSSRGSLVPLHFLPLGWCHLHIWGYWYFSRQSWFQLVLYPAWHFTWCTLHIS